MAKKRVHIQSTVNAANVSKAGSTYTIREVCGAVDDIVMNGMLYPADQLATGAPSLEGKPAPAGHPKNGAGQHISANTGEALASAYIGSHVRNARHDGGRTLVDVQVNEAQARALPAGIALVNRLDAAIAGTNKEPIHVSTGLFCEVINAAGESRGKKYSRIATNIAYDHLAILLNEAGAATPDDGVGMFLNAEGQPEPVEAVKVVNEPEDKRSAGLLAWIRKLVGNGTSEVSFEQISDGLWRLLPESAWVREVFDRYCVWTDSTGKLWKQDYSVSSDGSVAFSGQAVEVTRKVEYQPITNRQESDTMKDKILAALNAAGVKTDGLDEASLLVAYNALVTKPGEELLVSANSKIAGFETAAKAAETLECNALAKELAANGGSLTEADLVKLGLPRLKELKTNAAGAAPVLPGGASGAGKDPYEGYSINKVAADALKKEAA